jgi:hypothetical protein
MPFSLRKAILQTKNVNPGSRGQLVSLVWHFIDR